MYPWIQLLPGQPSSCQHGFQYCLGRNRSSISALRPLSSPSHLHSVTLTCGRAELPSGQHRQIPDQGLWLQNCPKVHLSQRTASRRLLVVHPSSPTTSTRSNPLLLSRIILPKSLGDKPPSCLQQTSGYQVSEVTWRCDGASSRAPLICSS